MPDNNSIKTYNVRLTSTRKSESDWSTLNLPLLDGEIVIYNKTNGDTAIKIGDGIHSFTDLPEFINGSLINDMNKYKETLDMIKIIESSTDSNEFWEKLDTDEPGIYIIKTSYPIWNAGLSRAKDRNGNFKIQYSEINEEDIANHDKVYILDNGEYILYNSNNSENYNGSYYIKDSIATHNQKKPIIIKMIVHNKYKFTNNNYQSQTNTYQTFTFIDDTYNIMKTYERIIMDIDDNINDNGIIFNW